MPASKLADRSSAATPSVESRESKVVPPTPDQAKQLEQARQDLLAYTEIASATNVLAQATVKKGKIVDYAACRLIPTELTRLKHYQAFKPFLVNQYRGWCVYYVEGFILDQKFKNRREEVLPPPSKK